MGKLARQSRKSKNGETVIIRSASPSDAGQLNDLAANVFSTSEYLITTPDEFSSITKEQQKERIQNFEADEGSILLVAEFQGELVGMLDFQNGRRKRIAHLGTFGMSVRSSWRNQGIGKILLAELIRWVKNHPIVEVINLGVIENNHSAVALYTKMGFEIRGREPFGVKLSDGSYLADLTMSLKVNK